MSKNFFNFIVVMAIVGSIAGYGIYLTQTQSENGSTEKMSDILLANVEALSFIEDGTKKCPDPYDVYNHQLSFSQRTGTFIIDANLEINVFGKVIKVVGGQVGSSVTITYEIGDCSLYSPGNCCPNSRNGEIHIL